MDATALTQDLLLTLDRLERRMAQVQADACLVPYVQQAHRLSTQLHGRLITVQGRLGMLPEEALP